MRIENVPSEFLTGTDLTMCAVSDDSRFFYMFINWDGLSLSVFDVVYNKFVRLLPDKNVTKLLTRPDGSPGRTLRPSILVVNSTTLLILFNDIISEEFKESGLLVVVQLNFSKCSFSIVDYKVINDCNYKARLVKNDTEFLIVHTFAVETEELEDEFLGYFTFFLHDNQILEIQKDRVVFDFDYENSGHFGTWNACNNKLWCIRKVGRTWDYELLYFNLSESNPKETSVKIFKMESFAWNTEEEEFTETMFQWSGDLLLIYYKNVGEFEYFNLTTCQWSNIFQRHDLRKIEEGITELKTFSRFDTFGSWSVSERYFDSDFNAIIIDKTKKLLFKVPFRTPPKLLDIAWTTVLNNGLLNELNEKGIVIFPKFLPNLRRSTRQRKPVQRLQITRHGNTYI